VVIDLQAIRHNHAFLQSLAPQSRLIAVIKADAYGHGALRVARALPDAAAFAVATVMEAIELREAGIGQKILVLGGVLDGGQMQACIDHGLDPVIHQDWQLDLLARAERHRPVDVWLKFNSGMGRLGFDRDGLEAALAVVHGLKGLGEIRLMTHLANADDAADEKSRLQIECVDALGLAGHEWGLANSAGIVAWPEARRHWVRAGIALYGADPMSDHRVSGQLKPAMRFETRLLAVNRLNQGDTVGYGGLFTCPRAMHIGVVAAGYADGYPRHLRGGRVRINGQSAPVVGRVSMDMITIDLEGIQARAGDRVILWGEDPLATEIAECSETIAYELFCHAGCHGWRRYSDDEDLA
jgi:alanine racemase